MTPSNLELSEYLQIIYLVLIFNYYEFMKVSICIPTYNQSHYLEIAVRSAFNQTLTPFEIIVSNDCSTDDTIQLLQKLQNELANLKVIHQPVNLGIAKNVDACLRAASGDFIIRMDSDDFLLPQYSEKLVKQMELFPEAGYAHAAVQEIDQFGNKTRIRKLSRNNCFQTCDKALKLAVKGYKVAANIIMFRRKALEAVNYSTNKPNYVEDFYTASSLSAEGYGNIYVNEVLSNYRVWIDTARVRQKRKLDEIVGLRKVAEEVLEPAYRKRNWSLAPIKKMRSNLAAQQSNCVCWDVYTKEEQMELTQAIFKLSSSKWVKINVWLYLNRCGLLLTAYKKPIDLSKRIVKSIMFYTQTQIIQK